MGVDDLGRQEPIVDQPAGPVDVGQDQFEEPGPLPQAGVEGGPLRRAEQMGDRVEGPQGRGPGGGRQRALVAAQAPHVVLGPQQRGPVGAEEVPLEPAPVRAGPAGGVVDLVEVQPGGGGGAARRPGGRGERPGHVPRPPPMGEG